MASISAVSAFVLAPRQASLMRRRPCEPLRVTPEPDFDFDFDKDGEGTKDEPSELELSSMVDDLIAEEDIVEQSKRMIASLYTKASIEVKEGLQGELASLSAEMEAKRAADADAATVDLFADIDKMTEELLRGKMERAAAKGPVSSGDKAADAALAAAEAKVAAARAARRQGAAEAGGAATAASSTSCVLVAAGPLGAAGPVARALADLLGTRGWTVVPLALPLDADPASSRISTTSTAAGDENAVVAAAAGAAALAACSTGACVVVCPERGGEPSPAAGGGGGGFLANLLPFKGPAPKEPLAPLDPRALAAALKAGGALAGAKRVVLLSECGTERAGVFPYSVRNTLGALDQRRSCEQAVVLFAKQTGADFTVLRVGDLQTGGRADVTLARGDVLDGSATPSSAAHALAQVVARQNPVARNVSLGVQGAGGGDLSDAAWDELFLPLDGPELWRLALPTGTSLQQARLWVQQWAARWAEKGSGLTTPVRVRETPTGVALFFDPKPTGYVSAREEKDTKGSSSSSSSSSRSKSGPKSKAGREGGLELVVDQPLLGPPGAASSGSAPTRVRAKRAAYAEGVAVKEKSEEVIMRRLKGDLARWAKNRG